MNCDNFKIIFLIAMWFATILNSIFSYEAYKSWKEAELVIQEAKEAITEYKRLLSGN